MTSIEIILYVDKNDPCEELTKKLKENGISFREWRVDPKEVDFQLPLLIAENGVYTEPQLLSYGNYLQKILVNT